jgi:hypothetical protein
MICIRSYDAKAASLLDINCLFKQPPKSVFALLGIMEETKMAIKEALGHLTLKNVHVQDNAIPLDEDNSGIKYWRFR